VHKRVRKADFARKLFTRSERKSLDLRYTMPIAVIFALLGLALTWVGVSHSEDCGNCAPDICQSDRRVSGALAAKKGTLKKEGYPDRLISLLDKNGQCVRCINGAPDGFTILTVKPNGDNQTVSWDEDNEANAKSEVKSGELTSYYLISTRLYCDCCNETKADERSDYDKTLDLNKSITIACSRSPNGDAICK
jgi:hypothetical protein